jgi:Ca2+/Na+ antiporter
VYNAKEMNSKKLTERMLAIFGATMVFFYFGLGIFIIISPQLTIEKPIRVIFAVPLLLYGVYRAVISYQKIRESFFGESEE